MLFSCACPKCGKNKDYMAEEVGKIGFCMQCGAAFVFKDNPRAVGKHVALALAGVTGSILLYCGAVFVRAQFQGEVLKLHDRLAEAERQAAQFDFDDKDN